MNYNIDGNDQMDRFEEELVKAQIEHAKRMVEYDIQDVAAFSQRISNQVLNKIDKVEDDEVALELTQLLGAVLGGYAKGVLDLKQEILELRKTIIDKESGEQDFTLN